jgi:hypothetical protein
MSVAATVKTYKTQSGSPLTHFLSPTISLSSFLPPSLPPYLRSLLFFSFLFFFLISFFLFSFLCLSTFLYFPVFLLFYNLSPFSFFLIAPLYISPFFLFHVSLLRFLFLITLFRFSPMFVSPLLSILFPFLYISLLSYFFLSLLSYSSSIMSTSLHIPHSFFHSFFLFFCHCSLSILHFPPKLSGR